MVLHAKGFGAVSNAFGRMATGSISIVKVSPIRYKLGNSNLITNFYVVSFIYFKRAWKCCDGN